AAANDAVIKRPATDRPPAQKTLPSNQILGEPRSVALVLSTGPPFSKASRTVSSRICSLSGFAKYEDTPSAMARLRSPLVGNAVAGSTGRADSRLTTRNRTVNPWSGSFRLCGGSLGQQAVPLAA